MGGFATEISFVVSRDWSSLQTPQFQTLKYWKLYEKKIGCYKSQEASVTSIPQQMEENLETQSIHL